MDSLLAYGVTSVAVTAGGPADVDDSRGAAGAGTITRRRSARDTLGAGDAFHGAAAFALAAGRTGIDTRLRRRVATVRVQYLGPREWLAALEAP